MKKYTESTPNNLAYSYLLKFLAAISIAVLTHMNKTLPIFTSLPVSVKEIPSAMVEFFFIFSGALFYISSFSKLMDKGGYSNYMKKRVFRIYPILILSGIWLTVSYILESWVAGAFAFEPLRMIVTCTMGAANAFTGSTYLSYNGPCWYIGVLMICYLIACLMTYLISKSQSKSVIWFLIPVVIGFSQIFTGKEVFLYNSFVIRGYVNFFLGICLVPLSQKILKLEKPNRITIKTIILVFGIINLLLIILGFQKVIKYSYPNKCLFGILVAAPLFVVLYGFKPVNYVCDNKVMKLLGGVSFPIYIFNEVIHHTWSIFDKNWEFAKTLGYYYILVDLLLHLVVGFVIYYLNKYFTEKIQKKRAVAAP